MDLIRIFYSPFDIKPESLLRHFFRSIGFYVEEIADDARPAGGSSVADLYIISSDYAPEFEQRMGALHAEKTIFIFKDGWSADGLSRLMQAVDYDGSGDDVFLYDVIAALDRVMVQTGVPYDRLIQSTAQWQDMVEAVARVYLQNDIIRVVQYSRYFYRQARLFDIAFDHYMAYIDDLERIAETFGRCALIQYIIAYAKYELNYVCKQNLYQCMFDPEELSSVCESLLASYESNEELYFLLADIHFELQGKWQRSCGEYEDIRVSHCAYGDYKCGRIVRKNLKEYDKAIIVLKRAVQMKPDYHEALYQLASAYEDQGRFSEAIRHYTRIVKILRRKYRRHLLSPLEMEYLYKALMEMSLISQYSFGDAAAGREYSAMADEVRGEIADDTYLSLIWPAALDDESMVQVIKDAMYEHIDMVLEKVYY